MTEFNLIYWAISLTSFVVSTTAFVIRTKLKKHPSDPWFTFYQTSLAILAFALMVSQNGPKEIATRITSSTLSLVGASLFALSFINYAARSYGAPGRIGLGKIFLVLGIVLTGLSILPIIAPSWLTQIIVFLVLAYMALSTFISFSWFNSATKKDIGNYRKRNIILLALGFSMVILVDISREIFDWWPDLQGHYILLPSYYVIINVFLTSRQLHHMRPIVEPQINSQRTEIWESLSPREQEIAELVKKGLSYQDIANTLFISLSTVKTHLVHMYAKSDSKNKIDFINKIS